MLIFRESAGRVAFMKKYEDAYQTIDELRGHIVRTKTCEGEARDALTEAEVYVKVWAFYCHSINTTNYDRNWKQPVITK